MLGVQVSGLPRRLKDASPLNSHRFMLGDGGLAIEIVVYRTELHRKGCPAWLVFHSPPGTWPARLEVCGWDLVDRTDDLKTLMDGVGLYRATFEQRGRPPGGPFTTPEEFARSLHEAMSEERRKGMNPTAERVSVFYDRNARTVSNWVRSYFGCTWKDVRAWDESDWRRAKKQ